MFNKVKARWESQLTVASLAIVETITINNISRDYTFRKSYEHCLDDVIRTICVWHCCLVVHNKSPLLFGITDAFSLSLSGPKTTTASPNAENIAARGAANWRVKRNNWDARSKVAKIVSEPWKVRSNNINNCDGLNNKLQTPRTNSSNSNNNSSSSSSSNNNNNSNSNIIYSSSNISSSNNSITITNSSINNNTMLKQNCWCLHCLLCRTRPLTLNLRSAPRLVSSWICSAPLEKPKNNWSIAKVNSFSLY